MADDTRAVEIRLQRCQGVPMIVFGYILVYSSFLYFFFFFFLTLSMMGKFFSRRHFEIVFLFFTQKAGIDISCKLSLLETICMTEPVFWNNKKIIVICRLLNLSRVWYGLKEILCSEGTWLADWNISFSYYSRLQVLITRYYLKL